MYSFEKKRVLITGGSSGIGLAAAKIIVDQGGQVLVTGSNPDKLARAKKLDERIGTLENDARDLDQVEALADGVRSTLGHVDGLFLNAGKGAHSPLGKITPAFFDEIYHLNVAGPLFQVQALLPLFTENGGAIVITSSNAAHRGYPGNAVYCGTKGAVVAMARSLARDLVEKNIRVNTVSPGPIATDFFERLGGSEEAGQRMEKYIEAGHPMGRLGTPEEAANVALFLLSDASGYVTGADYMVDGGSAQFK